VSEGWASAHARMVRASTHMPAVNGTGLSSHTPHGVRHAPWIIRLSARAPTYHEPFANVSPLWPDRLWP
jgi:hypothetical protein